MRILKEKQLVINHQPNGVIIIIKMSMLINYEGNTFKEINCCVYRFELGGSFRNRDVLLTLKHPSKVTVVAC